jgi:hypothetical protein
VREIRSSKKVQLNMGKVVGLAGDHASVDPCSRVQSVGSLYPNVSYHPVPGLVALFAGSGNHK